MTPKREAAFRVFKYSVYSLVTLNVALFLLDEHAAAAHFFAGGVSMAQFIEAYAATIDTAAWVLLLLLFELETSVIPDEQLKGNTKRLLHGVRASCYLVIVYAFYGYLINCLSLYQYVALPGASLCELVSEGFSFQLGLDDYSSITSQNCANLAADASLYGPAGLDFVTDASTLNEMIWLAWVDAINSAAWLLVVLVLEIDVRLQLKGLLEGMALIVSKVIKSALYAVLFVAALYWGVAGTFLDFWDAFLWLAAFIFIELNMFEWKSETSSG